VFLQQSKKRLWFGRDFLGRRSLLIKFPQSNDDLLVISSVGSKEASECSPSETEETDENRTLSFTQTQTFQEIPCSGLYSIDLEKLDNLCLESSQKTVCLNLPFPILA